MGFVVLLIVFGLVGLCIGVAKGVNSSGCDQRQGSGTVSDRGWSDADFDEDLDMDSLIDEPRSRKGGGSIFGSKSYESDFERLMRPGSPEAALFNAADESDYDPEDW